MKIPAKQIERGGYLLLYYLGTLLGKKKPLLGGIKLTHKCNLSCMHCPFRKRSAPSLTFPQVVSSLSTLHEWGVRIVIIEGGEPLLWQDGGYDVRDVIAEARKLFFTVGVTTNGTFPIEIGSDIVWVSIDGLKETHDRIRGQSFDRIMANLESSSHPRIYAHITINSLNWQEVPVLVEHLSHRVRGITVQFHYPYQEVDRGLFLPLDKRREVLGTLIEMKRQGLPLANSYACLEALRENRWKCRPWMIASVDPNGTLTHGCYLKGREEIVCEKCGFSAHTEISLAYGGAIEAILVGGKILLSHTRQSGNFGRH
jgi:MoaA/NifB/PqqE/SkfB family radical SAM enzyme